MDQHNNRHSKDVVYRYEDFIKNGTRPNNARIFQPKLIISDQFKKKYESVYVNALREALFTHFEKPYKAPEVPSSIFKEGDNASKYICRQCKDCFYHQTSLEEHTVRGSWILGYWCTDCFQECEHLSGKKLLCNKCIKVQIQKFKALQTRGLKRQIDPGIVRIFFNPCQLLEHMQMHNSEEVCMQQLMLLPFPSGIGREYFPHLKMISEALMDFMFINNIHIADWLLQNKIHKWWRMAKGDNPVANIIKKYPFEVQQIKHLLNSNSKGNPSKSNLNLGTVSLNKNKKNDAKIIENLSNENESNSSLLGPILMASNEFETSDAQSNDNIDFIDCGPCNNDENKSTDKQMSELSNNIGDSPDLTNTLSVDTNQTTVPITKAKISVKKFATVPGSPLRFKNVKKISSTLAAHSNKVNTKANHQIVTIHSAKPVNLSSFIKSFPQIAGKVANKKIVLIHKNLQNDEGVINLDDLQNNEVQNVGFLVNENSKDQDQSESSNSHCKSKQVINQSHILQNGRAIIRRVYPSIKFKKFNKSILKKINSDIAALPVKPVETNPQSNLIATLKDTTRKVLKKFFDDDELSLLTVKKNQKSGKNFLSVMREDESSCSDDILALKNKFFTIIKKMNRSKLYQRINHVKAVSRWYSEKVGTFDDEIVKGHEKFILMLENIAMISDYATQTVDDYFGPLVNLKNGEMCAICGKVTKSNQYIVGFSSTASDSDYCLCYDFICHKCNAFQGNKERFEAHLRYHNNESPFVCPECKVSFTSFQSLKIHTWTECFHPLIVRVITCNICDIGGFCSLESIINHFVVMHSKKVAACKFCCMVFEYKRFCTSHMKKGHAECTNVDQPLQLTICQLDAKVIPIESYSLHMNSHKCFEEVYFYKCNLCSGSYQFFNSKELIKTHIYNHHYSDLSSVIDADSLREILLLDDIQQLVKENMTIKNSNENSSINTSRNAKQTIPILETNDNNEVIQTIQCEKINDEDSRQKSVFSKSNPETDSIDSMTTDKEYCKNDSNILKSVPSETESGELAVKENLTTAESSRNQAIITLDDSDDIEQIQDTTESVRDSEISENSSRQVARASVENLEESSVIRENHKISVIKNSSQLTTKGDVDDNTKNDSQVTSKINHNINSEKIHETEDICFGDVDDNAKIDSQVASETNHNIISEEINENSLISNKLNKDDENIDPYDSSDSKDSYTTSSTEDSLVNDRNEDNQLEHGAKGPNNIIVENKTMDLEKSALNNSELSDEYEEEESTSINSTNLETNEERQKNLFLEKDEETDCNSFKDNDDLSSSDLDLAVSSEKDEEVELTENKRDNTQKSPKISNDSNLISNDQEKLIVSETNGYVESNTCTENQNQDSAKDLNNLSNIVDDSISDVNDSSNIVDDNMSDMNDSSNIVNENMSDMNDSSNIANDNINNINDSSNIADNNIHDSNDSSNIADNNIHDSNDSSNIADDNINDTKNSSNIADDQMSNKTNEDTVLRELSLEDESNEAMQTDTDNLKLHVNEQSDTTKENSISADNYVENELDTSSEIKTKNAQVVRVNSPACSMESQVLDCQHFEEQQEHSMDGENNLDNERINENQYESSNELSESLETEITQDTNNKTIDDEELNDEHIKLNFTSDDSANDCETGKELNNDTEISHGNLTIESLEEKSLSDNNLHEESEVALENNVLLDAEKTIPSDKTNDDLGKTVDSTLEDIPISDENTLKEYQNTEGVNDLITIKENNKLDQYISRTQEMNENELPEEVSEVDKSIATEYESTNQIDDSATEKLNYLDQDVIEENQMNKKSSLEGEEILGLHRDVEDREQFEAINALVTIVESSKLDQLEKDYEINVKASLNNEKFEETLDEVGPISAKNIDDECKNIEEITESLTIERSNELDQCIDEEIQTNDKSFTDIENILHSSIEEISATNRDISMEFDMSDDSSKLDHFFDIKNKVNKISSPDNEKLERSIIEELCELTEDMGKKSRNPEDINESLVNEENEKLYESYETSIKESQADEGSFLSDKISDHSLIQNVSGVGIALTNDDNYLKDTSKSVTYVNEKETNQVSNVQSTPIETNSIESEDIFTNKNSLLDTSSACPEQTLTESELNKNDKVHYSNLKLIIEQDSEDISLADKILELEQRSNNRSTKEATIDNEETSNSTADSFENNYLLCADQLTVESNQGISASDKNRDENNANSECNRLIADCSPLKNRKDAAPESQSSFCTAKENLEVQRIKNTDTEDIQSSELSNVTKQADVLYCSNVKNNKNDSAESSFLFGNVSPSAETPSAVVDSHVKKTNAFLGEIDDSSGNNLMPDAKENKSISMSQDVMKCNDYELNNLSLTDDEKINLSKNSATLESQIEKSVDLSVSDEANAKRLRSRSSNRLGSSHSRVVRSKRKYKVKGTGHVDKAKNAMKKSSRKSRIESSAVDSSDTATREKKLVRSPDELVQRTRSRSKRRKEETSKGSDVPLDDKSDADETIVCKKSLKRCRSDNVKLKDSLLIQMPTLRLIKTSTRSSPVDFSDPPEKAPRLRAVEKHKIAFDSSTSKSSKIHKFRCHLCGDSINTSWSVLAEHFGKRHLHNYELCTLSPKLTRIPESEAGASQPRRGDKKRKSSEEPPANFKRRKRSSPKKPSEKASLDRTSGLFVQLELIIDKEGHFKCKKCDERCVDMVGLRRHISANHRIARKNLICLECGENFVVSPSLQMHLKAFHGIDDPIGYMSKYPDYAPDIDDFEAEAKTTAANQCHVCMAVFKDQLSVDKHLRVHGMAFLSRKRREARNAQLTTSRAEKSERDQLGSAPTKESRDKTSGSISSR